MKFIFPADLVEVPVFWLPFYQDRRRKKEGYVYLSLIVYRLCSFDFLRSIWNSIISIVHALPHLTTDVLIQSWLLKWWLHFLTRVPKFRRLLSRNAWRYGSRDEFRKVITTTLPNFLNIARKLFLVTALAFWRFLHCAIGFQLCVQLSELRQIYLTMKLLLILPAFDSVIDYLCIKLK